MASHAEDLNIAHPTAGHAHNLKNILQVLCSSVEYLEGAEGWSSQEQIDDLRFVTGYAKRLVTQSIGQPAALSRNEAIARADAAQEICRAVRCAQAAGIVAAVDLKITTDSAAAKNYDGQVWRLMMALLRSPSTHTPVDLRLDIKQRDGDTTAELCITAPDLSTEVFQIDTPTWRSIVSRVWTLGGNLNAYVLSRTSIKAHLTLPRPTSTQ